ncbi:MAG: dockerin type I domain-containing protein, partial [Pirellulaceae bacterium]|nr:dockerin type I domain-containing protein [Pirellulaceae bacterium]
EVEDVPYRWQNPVSPVDVSGDGMLTPTDVLIVVNDLNLNGPRKLPTIGPPDPPPFLDVNGDGFVTSNDVVILINEINRQVGSCAEAEGSVNVIDDPFGRLDFPAPTFESFRIKEDMPLRRGEVTVRRDFAAIVSATRASAVQSSNLQARLMPAQRASETDELESLLELLAADLVSQQEVGL